MHGLPVYDSNIMKAKQCHRSTLKAQQNSNQAHTRQLKLLIETVGTAAAEIKKFLVDAKLSSERLEELIKFGNLSQKELIQISTTLKWESGETHKLVKDLSQWRRKYTAGVQDAVDDSRTQMVKLFSLTKYLEEWMSKIVRYCKEIISMVQRNTELLLSLHGMLAKFEWLLSCSKIELPSIVFENVFGIKMILPYQLCTTWKVSICSLSFRCF